MTTKTDRFLPYAVLFLFCLASLAFRPLLPPDETRYLTVAWEMFLSRDWFVPTLNFAPYHHKPPLLFWLINAAWALFGVGRPAVAAVMFTIASLAMHLTLRLGRALFPGRADIAARLPWLMLGSAAFLIYSGLILFDLLLTCCILAAFLAFLAFARGQGLRYAVLAGLFIGLGVLAKGPVVLIHLAWPVGFYAFWRSDRETLTTGAFLRGAAIAVLAALIPVAVWLVPALVATDGSFAYALIWEQSAGRISGNMEQSHPRPFYFYLLLLPVLGIPWMLLPGFWRSFAAARRTFRERLDSGGPDIRVLRLLLVWSLGVLAIFSLISGKQPHYLVPLLPLVAIALAYAMADVPLKDLRGSAVITAAVLLVAQGIAASLFFPKFDVSPVAAYIADRPEASFGYSGSYSGEFGYLARLHRPIEVVDRAATPGWLAAHPGGFLINYDRHVSRPADGEVLAIPYRDGRLTIVAGGAPSSARPDTTEN